MNPLLVVGLACFNFAAAFVQSPVFTSCSRVQDVQISNVTISNARIGQRMTVDFTLNIRKPLTSSPRLAVTVRNKNGLRLPCVKNVGSCIYKLCGGKSSAELFLGRLWDNACPVPAITTTESVTETLVPALQTLVGNAPTTLSVQMEVYNGASSVGCQKFDITVAES